MQNMKKILVLVTIVGFSVATLCNCGGNSSEKITVTGADGKEYPSYQAACRELDFDAAHNYLDLLYNKYSKAIGKDPSAWDGSSEEIDLRNVFFPALEYIYTHEIVYISSLEDYDLSDNLLFLIREFPFVGQCPPEGLAHVGVGRLDGSATGRNLIAYKNSVTSYNKICDAALDVSIKKKNRQLATTILNLFKPNIEITRGSGVFIADVQVKGVDVTEEYVYVTFDNSAVNNAIEKMENAEKSGAFK